MLELNKITKIYNSGDFKQKALNSVSLTFPESGFVSILGPSGSGKTTLLNIVGGLDHYTTGDLIIDEISTKNFKDSDWDSYRNHRIGFVFQNYNLIPHQSVLNNVRLALTLSGIPKREGRLRAKKALENVGLKEHIYKRPSQLSGGQMQRVAIARALVNDPDIILADEPTGALDSETSVQIMKLLKDISQEKLIIMVTHNPELAEQYSTRIINLKDGAIVSDKNINTAQKKIDIVKTVQEPAKKPRKTKKTRMSFLTALSLSFNNLLTKKGRTILVAFAGSIGIIGIALILAVSTGFQNYIDSIQEDTLNSYPLTLTEESFSLASLFTMGTDNNPEYEKLKDMRDKNPDKELLEAKVLTTIFNSVATNDLKSFNDYFHEHKKELDDSVSSVNYGYSVEPNIYTIDATNSVVKLNPSNAFSSVIGDSGSLALSLTGSPSSVYTPIIAENSALKEQYDILAGRLPENYDEAIINLSVEGTITDLLAYNLGLKDTAELGKLVQKLMSGETVNIDTEPLALNYEDLLNLDLRVILPSDLYEYNEKYSVYEDMSNNEQFLKNVYENKSFPLKIVGVITQKDGVTVGSLEEGVNYSPKLIEHIINLSKNTEIVKKQLDNPEIDVFSGVKFDQENDKFNYEFSDLVSFDESKIEQAFNVKIDQNELARITEEKMTAIADSIDIDTKPAEDDLNSAIEKLFTGFYDSLPEIFKKSEREELIEGYLNTYEPGELLNNLESTYKIPKENLKQISSGLLRTAYISYVGAYAMIDPSITEDPENPAAKKNDALYETIKTSILSSAEVKTMIEELAKTMTEIKIKTEVMTKVGELVSEISSTFAQSINIDPSAITSAFKLNFSEDELMRVISSMMNNTEKTQKTNLISLGYQNLENPTYISYYFTSFDGKEVFLDFIKEYNEKVGEGKQINYTDTTGILMSSVKVIVDAVSYVLIAFVSISLVVSSIMIGIITYISVYERTKEIGILRAIGASKRNISNIFNAETFIIGLLSGIFGIIISYIDIPIINSIIHAFTGDIPLNASLKIPSAIILIILSVFLTLIGGLIPARAASRKDPVEALRTE